MRLVNNFRVMRVQALARKGEFAQARTVIRTLISRRPRSVGYNLLLADIEMLSGNLSAALIQYEKAKKFMELEPGLSGRNRRYLAAYANFRILAMKHYIAGREWPEWRGVAKVIEELDADKRFKRVFKLPT